MAEAALPIELSEDHRQRMRNVVDATVTAYIDELPQRLKARLDEGVFQMLGFNTTWREWRIDDSKGTSPIAQMIKEAALKLAPNIVTESIKKALAKVTAKRKALIAEVVEDSMLKATRWRLESEARDLAQKWVDNCIKSLSKDLDNLAFGGLIPAQPDVNEESHWRTQIATRFLEKIAEDFCKRDKKG